MVIKGTTQLLGVIGYPVKHSFSPLMHNAAIAHLQSLSPESDSFDYVYLPFPIRPDVLKAAVDGFSAIGLRGFNITIPHKQAIMPLLDEVSEVASAIGAVNTVWRSEADGRDRWHGTNTDAAGFLAPLKALSIESGINWSDTPAIVLGNGGAARAVVAACVELGCAEVWVCGRSPQKLETFAQSWQTTSGVSNRILDRLSVVAWDDMPAYLPKAGLVVNATPVGMYPHVESSPLSEAQMDSLGRSLPAAAKKIAYDLIYTPRPTEFLKQAERAGFVAIDGLEMLVQQGAAALEIWIDQPAPVDVMRRSLLDYLGQ